MNLALIITAGGTSSRFGKNKLLQKVHGKELILYTLEAFKHYILSQVIITVTPETRAFLESAELPMKVQLVDGGETRQASVYNALNELRTNTEMVIIHDGARPMIDDDSIFNAIDWSIRKGASTAGVKVVDTIKRVGEKEVVLETIDRTPLRAIQTPQVFVYDIIMNAHRKFEGQNFSDDAGLVEAYGHEVYVSVGAYTNIKITTKEDMKFARSYFKRPKKAKKPEPVEENQDAASDEKTIAPEAENAL